MRKIPSGTDGHKPDRDQSQFVLFSVDHQLARSPRLQNPIPVGETTTCCVDIRSGNKVETVTYRDQKSRILPSSAVALLTIKTRARRLELAKPDTAILPGRRRHEHKAPIMVIASTCPAVWNLASEPSHGIFDFACATVLPNAAADQTISRAPISRGGSRCMALSVTAAAYNLVRLPKLFADARAPRLCQRLY